MERKQLSVLGALKKYSFEKSLLIGFYGGGNYGDELLLEILQNLLKAQNVQHVTIPYKNPDTFRVYHHDFGYQIVSWNPLELLKALLSNKNIVVGGGGLWGLDASFKILAFGILLFLSRWVFQKRVYLLGVGYYGSTPRIGHVSAWLAGKAARVIVARDAETYDSFVRVQSHTYLDKDMAWHTPKIDLKPYQDDVAELEREAHIQSKTICIILRRFAAKHANEFNQQVERFISQNPHLRIVVTLMEPRGTFPEGYDLLEKWQHKYPYIQTVEYKHNPLVLFLFFQKHRRELVLIAPQFHAIITAHLNEVPFLPIVYDNKVSALLDHIGERERIPIRELSSTHLQSFVDAAEGGKG